MFYTFLSPLWWFKKLKERTQEIQPPRGTKRRRDEEPFRDWVTDEPGWTWNLDTPAVLNTSKFVGVFSALKCHFQWILFINGNKQVAIRFEKTWIFLRHGIDNIVHPIATCLSRCRQWVGRIHSLGMLGWIHNTFGGDIVSELFRLHSEQYLTWS